MKKSRSYLTSAARIKYLKVHKVSGENTRAPWLAWTLLPKAGADFVTGTGTVALSQGDFLRVLVQGRGGQWPTVLWFGDRKHTFGLILTLVCRLWVQNWCSCTFVREVWRILLCFGEAIPPGTAQIELHPWGTGDLQKGNVRMCSADEPRASHTVFSTASTQAKHQQDKNKPKNLFQKTMLQNFPFTFFSHSFADNK